LLDRGQPQVVEQQRQPGAVDAFGYAASPRAESRSLPRSAW
jgi:hypothetical protein